MSHPLKNMMCKQGITDTCDDAAMDWAADEIVELRKYKVDAEAKLSALRLIGQAIDEYTVKSC